MANRWVRVHDHASKRIYDCDKTVEENLLTMAEYIKQLELKEYRKSSEIRRYHRWNWLQRILFRVYQYIFTPKN